MTAPTYDPAIHLLRERLSRLEEENRVLLELVEFYQRTYGKARLPLTKRQWEILDYITAYIRVQGYSPTYREIADHFELASLATVHEHLASIERKGWITKQRNEARAITLTQSAA